ncbi:MAG: helix-turn-helix domain-containing protein [Candidatus Hodarchaeales archaeon]|jgi:DNA invertase Pin-like site-specific DNA recombinase
MSKYSSCGYTKLHSKNRRSPFTHDGSIRNRAISLFRQGVPIPDIAEKLKVSKIFILRSLLPDETISGQIKAFLNQGLSYSKIGEILGIDGKTVIQRAKKAGLDDINSAAISEMFQNEIPVNKIAKELNMSHQQVIARIPHSIRLERLINLYIKQKLSYKEITIKLGIGRTSLKNWLRRYNLMNRHLNAGIELKNYPKRKIIGDYLRLNSIKTIAQKRSFSETTILRILDEAGIKRTVSLANIRKHVKGVFNIPVTPYLKEVLTGELLGDLSLEKSCPKSCKIFSEEKYIRAIKYLRLLQKRSPEEIEEAVTKFNKSLEVINRVQMTRLMLNMSILATPWVQYIKEFLEKKGTPMSYGINNANTTAAKYHTISIWSRYSVQFMKLYHQWYPNGKKIVPKNIQMSPTTLLHWFIGDGYSSKSGLGLSTHSFSVIDVEFLIAILNESLEIRSLWRYDHNRQPVISIHRNKDIQTFYNYLERANPESLSLAKELFPWKFNVNLRKYEVMRSERYPEILCRHLGNEFDNLSHMIRNIIKRYYFKDS